MNRQEHGDGHVPQGMGEDPRPQGPPPTTAMAIQKFTAPAVQGENMTNQHTVATVLSNHTWIIRR